MKTKQWLLLVAISSLALGALAGCSSESTTPTTNESLSLSFSTYNAAKSFQADSFNYLKSDTLSVGQDVLILDRVQIVLREIELKRASAEDCLEDGDCEKFEVGPFLVELPLNGSIAKMVEIAIDPDTYNEIEFDVHKPSDDGVEDQDFLAANPDFAETSVKVEGSFNGEDFVYTSDLSVEQEIDLTPPLVIGVAEMSSNLTLRVMIDQWFVDQSGALINPASANSGGVNEGVVEDNIQASMEAFEDDDEDGDDSDELED
jgi:hypothetical protein